MNPIPQGYKQTEIGVIPEDWVVGTTREIIQKMTSGLSRRLADHDIGMPVIISGNIQNNKLDISDLKYWYKNDPQGADTNDYVLNDGDILLCFINSLAQIGKPCIYRDIGRPVIYTTNLFRIVISESSVNEFAYYLFSTEAFQKNLQLISKIAVNQASFTKPDFLNSKIAYPKSKSEQSAIATALSDVDALITGLESLIAKKQAIKTATMQQLLTGKTRLPQFAHNPDGTPKGYQQTELGEIPEDWRLIELGVISDVTKLAGFEYTNHFNSYKDGGEIIVVRGTNITNNVMDLSDIKCIPKSTSQQLPRSKLFKDDLVFAYVGTIGPVFLIEENDKFHLGPNTAKISCKASVQPSYLFSYFKSTLIKSEIEERISIGAQPSLSMEKIRSFKIILPISINEQSAIAQILSDMDEEIQTLQSRLSKTQQIKQGMMQHLLTGKVRLVKPELQGTQNAC